MGNGAVKIGGVSHGVESCSNGSPRIDLLTGEVLRARRRGVGRVSTFLWMWSRWGAPREGFFGGLSNRVFV